MYLSYEANVPQQGVLKLQHAMMNMSARSRRMLIEVEVVIALGT